MASNETAQIRPRLLKTKTAATYIGRSPSKLRQMALGGEIPYIPGDGSTSPWLFDTKDLDAWVERSKVSNG